MKSFPIIIPGPRQNEAISIGTLILREDVAKDLLDVAIGTGGGFYLCPTIDTEKHEIVEVRIGNYYIETGN